MTNFQAMHKVDKTKAQFSFYHKGGEVRHQGRGQRRQAHAQAAQQSALR